MSLAHTPESRGSAAELARRGVAAAAAGHGGLGLALLFAGQEVSRALFGRPGSEPSTALLGAALLGFAAMNWIARASPLGGIYGRAVVVGNQVHFLVGALVLLKHGLASGGTPGLWSVAAVYAVAALVFAWILLGPGARRR